MFSHNHIWQAIDALAQRHQMSPSGLARLAGLDSTTFNKSKRITADGRKRWPSTESLSKIFEATGTSMDDFLTTLSDSGRTQGSRLKLIPLIGLAQAGGGGFFDDGGFPAGSGWDEVAFPQFRDENAYALEITGESMQPLYRDGDTIIVSPNAGIRRNDRIVIKTREGEVMAKILHRQTAHTIELSSVNPDHKTLSISTKDILWMARIIWASQ